MSKVEELVKELCNEMMDEASRGGLEAVMTATVSIIEYSGYELARQGRSSSSIMLFQAAKYLEERASVERRSRKDLSIEGETDRTEPH